MTTHLTSTRLAVLANSSMILKEDAFNIGLAADYLSVFRGSERTTTAQLMANLR